MYFILHHVIVIQLSLSHNHDSFFQTFYLFSYIRTDAHLIAWFSAGAFVILGFPISIYGILMHLTNYYQPNVQCYVVRILWMGEYFLCLVYTSLSFIFESSILTTSISYIHIIPKYTYTNQSPSTALNHGYVSDFTNLQSTLKHFETFTNPLSSTASYNS